METPSVQHQSSLSPQTTEVWRPLCIGHRGAAAHAPENTLLSVDKALMLGADWIEVDVQLARGEPVVIHNRRLQDSTLACGLVHLQDPARLRQVDAGEGQHVPTLRELILHLDRRAVLNIELKAPGSGLATARLLRGLLRQGWRIEDFVLSSFDQHELRAARAELPRLRTGVLMAGIPLDFAAVAQAQGAWSLHMHVDFVNSDFVADARRRGLKVFVYTVNYPEDAEWLMDLGVDGMFTDYPERIRRLIDQRYTPAAA